MTVLTTDGWKMQWRRVERGFAKLSAVYNDCELYDDDLYHFFQDAWHLKDWIKNDPAVPTNVRAQIEKELDNITYFRITADFANGTTHMLLKRPRQENAQFIERNVTVALGSGSAQARQERILTLVDRSQIAAESVASNVIREWEFLLRRLNLTL